MIVTKEIKDKVLSICLSSEEYERWKEYAAQHNYKSMSNFVRYCVNRVIKQ